MAHIERPSESAPAIAWAEYYEALAALYRRQAAYETRLAVIDSTLAQHGDEIDELHSRVEGLEAGMQMLPEILERLGPETLTPEHQRTVQNAVKRLHEVGGYAYATIYAELGQHFHVAKYDQILEARWEEVAEWCRVRLDAAEKRTRRKQANLPSWTFAPFVPFVLVLVTPASPLRELPNLRLHRARLYPDLRIDAHCLA